MTTTFDNATTATTLPAELLRPRCALPAHDVGHPLTFDPSRLGAVRRARGLTRADAALAIGRAALSDVGREQEALAGGVGASLLACWESRTTAAPAWAMVAAAHVYRVPLDALTSCRTCMAACGADGE